MPVERIAAYAKNDAELIRALVEEYKLGDNSPNKEPRIRFEQTSLPNIVHVYVIWSRWEGVPQSVRSRIIMDALEEVLPPEELLKVTLTWGLTEGEWQKYTRGPGA